MLIIAFTESCDNDIPLIINFILFLLIVLYTIYLLFINHYTTNTISDDETELTIINTDIIE